MPWARSMPCSAAYACAFAPSRLPTATTSTRSVSAAPRRISRVDVRRRQAGRVSCSVLLRFGSVRDRPDVRRRCRRHVGPSPGRGDRLADPAEGVLARREIGRDRPTVDVTRQASPDDTRGDARLRQYPGDRERRGRRPELGRDRTQLVRRARGSRRAADPGTRGASRRQSSSPKRAMRSRSNAPGEQPRGERRVAQHPGPVLERPTARPSSARRGRAARAAAEPSRHDGPPRSARAARRRSSRRRSTAPCPPRRARPSSPTTPRAACPSSSRASAPGRGRCARSPSRARLRSHSSRIDSGRRSFPITPSGSALPAPSALREDEHVLPDPVRPHGAADDLLGVAEPVDRRGVDPVDAELDRTADRGDGIVVVDPAPAEPPRAADRPRAEPDALSSGPTSPELPSSSRERPSLLVQVVAPGARRRPPEQPLRLRAARRPTRPRERSVRARCPRPP